MINRRRFKHWSNGRSALVPIPEIDKFIKEIKTVCKKHGMSISHENMQRSFVNSKLQ